MVDLLHEVLRYVDNSTAITILCCLVLIVLGWYGKTFWIERKGALSTIGLLNTWYQSASQSILNLQGDVTELKGSVKDLQEGQTALRQTTSDILDQLTRRSGDRHRGD